MRVLITGIEGFVGRHLAYALLRAGHEAFGTVLREVDLEQLRQDLPEVPLDRADLRFGGSLDRSITCWRPHCIAHCAAQSSGSFSLKNPVTTYRVNVIGTMNVLEAARLHEWDGRVLIVSSADVYGNVGSSRLLGENDPLRPINHYAASKAMAEMVAEQYFHNHGVRTVRVRSFPHTGPGQSPRFALSSFAKQIALAESSGGGKLRVGNLEIVRDYLDVRDVVKAYIAVLEDGRDGEVYNVAGGRSHSLRKLLDDLIGLSEASIEVVQDDRRMRKVDIEYQVGDSAKLTRETGWKPEIGIEDTLRDLIDYWRGRVAN
ncbi:MAG: GDP-mannose 4,6-dehydratase [Candidatus Glassbacteria bacterium]